MTSDNELRDLSGIVATVCISGTIPHEHTQAVADMRSWCDRNDFHRIEWKNFDAKLVERGRDAVCTHALQQGYDWILQIDADAAPFNHDCLIKLLQVAFLEDPSLDMVGAYCQLKQRPFLPTIDTGTGTWEMHWPNSGVLPVIRTGGHFFLLKTAALRKFGPPWFRSRLAANPAQAFAEVDNFARTRLDGTNPLAKLKDWKTLMAQAKSSSPSGASNVGEDSGFCDALRAHGGRIAVNTNVIVGHLAKRVIGPEDLRDERSKIHEAKLKAVGIG